MFIWSMADFNGLPVLCNLVTCSLVASLLDDGYVWDNDYDTLEYNE